MTLAEVITSLSTFFTAFLSMAADIVGFITDNPLILIFVLVSLVFSAVNLVKRFL